MDKNQGFGFTVNEEAGMDISSRSDSFQEEYEDIVSDSHQHASNHSSVGLYPSDQKYRKKKHGIAGFFQSVSDGWKRLKGWQKGLWTAGISLFLVIAIFLSWFFITFRYNYRRITTNPDDLGISTVLDKKIVNVALFGIDTRDKTSFTGLSDSIMLLSLNTQTKTVKIISFMRDTLVQIDENGKKYCNKINSAYAKGGPELAIKTLNQNFGLDIKEYATVNFYGMSDIIDAVGGIDATITEREVTARGNNNHGINDMIAEICGYLGYNPNDYYVKKAGEQHLNGIQAVAYSRIRYVPNIWGTNNDYGRTDRQRYVMEQLFNKAVTLKKSDYVKLAKALIPCTETSLSYSDILSLAVNILLQSPSFQQTRIPQNDYLMTPPTIKGVGSCVYFDLDFAKTLIHQYIYEEVTFDEYVAANGISKNDWYRKLSGGASSGGNASQHSGTSSGTTSGIDAKGSSSTVSEADSSRENQPIVSKPETDLSGASEKTESTEKEASKPEENTSSANTSSDQSNETSSGQETTD
ncbi:MAG: LCP family protein [Clostridia bacterium]|nr:LCP family protein [Clostridia bacterium]